METFLTRTFRGRRRLLVGVVLACGAALSIGCERKEEATTADKPSADTSTNELHAPLIFPPALKVEDETVNEFLTHAMSVCGRGDYSAFRLLWSAREEPLPRDEFKRGWSAVQRIRILILQPVKLPKKNETGGEESLELVYAVCADVQLDADQIGRQHDPDRRVVLLIVREKDSWRLANPPRELRDWVREQVDERNGSAARDDANPLPPVDTDKSDG